MSLLEERGTFPHQLLTNLLCCTGKFRDALYVEELGRARVLAEIMADKYSAESYTSADPQSWLGIENILKRESVFSVWKTARLTPPFSKRMMKQTG